eukprot:Sspe_Gene.11346::Locus_3833_Transcript_1_1_Confidence_1.000_Length_13808::g.11346::m.11346
MLTYPASKTVTFRDITVTIRDSAGNWLRHWDTQRRTIYLKTRLKLDSGEVRLDTVNSRVVFKGLQSTLPREDKYTFLFTTDPEAPVPADLWQYENQESVVVERVTVTPVVVEPTRSNVATSDRYTLYPSTELTGTPLEAASLTAITLPNGAVPSGVYFQLSSAGADSSGLRVMDGVECIQLCDAAQTCVGWFVQTLNHRCFLLSAVSGRVSVADSLAAEVVATRTATYFPTPTLDLDSCAARNCSDPDESGMYFCTYPLEVPLGTAPPAPTPSPSSKGPIMTPTLPPELTMSINISFADMVQALNQSLWTVTETIAPEAVKDGLLEESFKLFRQNPPPDACLENCVPRNPPTNFFFSSSVIITISEGTPHHMVFVKQTIPNYPFPIEYSNATTNKRALDIQPIVVIVDISLNVVNTFVGSPMVAAVVKPYCIRTPDQTLENFRYPYTTSFHGGCQKLLTEKDLEGGVETYGRIYGPSCHGVAAAGQTEEEFEKTCERLRGANAWVVNGRATFSELHFRGCASDIGVSCTADVQYRIHFTFSGGTVSLPELITDPIYTANCPKSTAPVSSVIPPWTKLSGGTTITLKGWDFQPGRNLKVNVGATQLVPDFVDTCTARMHIPSQTAASRFQTLAFNSPSAAKLQVVDEDNPDFKSDPLPFQIKSSLPEKIGMPDNPIRNLSYPDDSIPCSTAGDQSREPTFPRRCYRTAPTVNVGELQIILKDKAGGDLYAIGSYDTGGVNFGFFEEVKNPVDPNGPKVWGRQYPGSVSQAADIFIRITVSPPADDVSNGTTVAINQLNSKVNMTESNGEGNTVDGLLVIGDAQLFYPKTGEYIFYFNSPTLNAQGNTHQQGGVRISIAKGNAVRFNFLNKADMKPDTDGQEVLQPSPKLELLDIANNTLAASDVPHRGLEVLATVRAYKILRYPPPEWSGWAPHEEKVNASDCTTLVDTVLPHLTWQPKVDPDLKLHPQGVPVDATHPRFLFKHVELGGDTYTSPTKLTYTAANGEQRVTQVWHSGPSLEKTSVPLTIGVEFKDQKVKGLWHGVVYNISYSWNHQSYESLGIQSHNIVRVACSNGQFSVNFSQICADCPVGATCDGTQWLAAQAGYWRANQEDITFYKCRSDACRGGFWAGDKSCVEGAKGPLCAVCEDGYGRNDDQCLKCPDPVENVFMLILIVVALGLVIFIMVRANLSSGAKGKSLLSIVLKIFMNHLQTASLMRSFLVRVESLLASLLDAEEKASGPSTQFLSFSCATGFDQYEVFLSWMLCPVMIFVLPGLVALGLHLRRTRRKETMMHSLVTQRDRRYSLGMGAEEEEQQIAILHAVHTGKPIPQFKGKAESKAASVSDVSSETTDGNELVYDPAQANEVHGAGLSLGDAMRSGVADDIQAGKDQALQRETLKEVKRLERAQEIAKEERDIITAALSQPDRNLQQKALEIIERAKGENNDPRIHALEKRLQQRMAQAEADEPESPPPLERPPWEEKVSRTHGRKYWMNKETGESTWVKPQELVEYEAAVERAKEERPLESTARGRMLKAFGRQNLSQIMPTKEDVNGDLLEGTTTAAQLAKALKKKAMVGAFTIDQKRIRARRRWAMVRDLVMQGVMQKQEERRKKEEISAAWQLLSKPMMAGKAGDLALVQCMVCKADFSALMCKECGAAAKREYFEEIERRKARETASGYFAGVVDDKPMAMQRTWLEHENGHSYFYLCQQCDTVVHAKRGLKGNHNRIRVKPREDNEEIDTTTQLGKIRKAEKSTKPEVVYMVTILVVIFLAYPRLMTEIATMMKCIDIPDLQKSFLEADMTIECGTNRYSRWKRMAVVFFFIYGLGIPIFGIFLLSLWSGADGSGLLRKKVVESFGFLYSGYRMDRYYWEMIIMFRKMLVVFILVFYEGKENFQIMLGLWLMTFFLLVNIFARPFMFHILWRIENLSLACVAVSLNLSMLYQDKYDLTPGGPEETIVTLSIFIINLCTVGAFIYCLVIALKAQIIDALDDPNDPDGSLSWEEAKIVFRIKFYRKFGKPLARVGIKIKNPEEAIAWDVLCMVEDEAQKQTTDFAEREAYIRHTVDTIKRRSAADSADLGGSRRKSVSAELEAAERRRSSVAPGMPMSPLSPSNDKTVLYNMPPAMVKVLGYHKEFPEIFDDEGRRRIRIGSPLQNNLEGFRGFLQSPVTSPKSEAFSVSSKHE